MNLSPAHAGLFFWQPHIRMSYSWAVPTWLFRRLFNLWGPFRCAGIVVTHLTPDWRYARVELRQRVFNRNYVGTHFGGSLFAMTDPFYMLLLFHNLGPRYFVWDKTGAIDYVAPGRGTVHAEFRLTEPLIEDIKREAESGQAVRPEFDLVVSDANGGVVARVHKQLYVRLKPKHRRS